jgi:4-amino-4-deoxy-L-arabinose transferase-like glycosyltransferase
MSRKFTNRRFTILGLLWFLLLVVLLVRLVTMALFPVIDTTEARYAEISRLMLESGDWIVPQISPGEPFWGKPPLFAWLSAGSAAVLGMNEFSARLPHFLLAIATLCLVLRLARGELKEQRSVLALVILASTPLFFAAAGTVMTESGLLLSTTLSMAGFWRFARHGEKLWGLLFFVGLGLGMLAKGPIAMVMILVPILIWCFTRKQRERLIALPWLGGSLLFLLISLPWYLLAEHRSPGFIEYFIVGEHLLRFIQPGWSGDLYGNAHSEPIGMIWLLWFQATAAWGILMAWVAGRYCLGRYREKRWAWPVLNDWQSYLAWWMLVPLLFFTFSGNILWTYVITGLPAFALLLASPQEEAAE